MTLGATWLERHITLDRNLWGSDQKSSIEPSGLIKLVKGIRDIEKVIQHPWRAALFDAELSKRASLRGMILYVNNIYFLSNKKLYVIYSSRKLLLI